MTNNQKRVLGGHLIGIGKKLKTGEIEYTKLKTPIHNMITRSGLDHLFQWAGPDFSDLTINSYTYSYGFNYNWVGKGGRSGCGYRAGALEYMSYGSGTRASSFSDTNLESGSGVFTSTKYSESNELNGTRYNSLNGYSFRVSHITDPVQSSTTVNEIGWFGAYDSTSSYSTKVLFSRVVLQTPFILNEGESLITTYQLDETCSNFEPQVGTFLNGTLPYEKRLYRFHTISNTWSCTSCGEPAIRSNGAQVTLNTSSLSYLPPYSRGTYSTGVASGCGYSTSVDKIFPTIGSSDTSNITKYTSSTITINNDEYVPGTFRRTCTISIPCSTTMDIYYLRIYGMDYRFGYYDGETWISQPWTFISGQTAKIKFGVEYTTENSYLESGESDIILESGESGKELDEDSGESEYESGSSESGYTIESGENSESGSIELIESGESTEPKTVEIPFSNWNDLYEGSVCPNGYTLTLNQSVSESHVSTTDNSTGVTTRLIKLLTSKGTEKFQVVISSNNGNKFILDTIQFAARASSTKYKLTVEVPGINYPSQVISTNAGNITYGEVTTFTYNLSDYASQNSLTYKANSFTIEFTTDNQFYIGNIIITIK